MLSLGCASVGATGVNRGAAMRTGASAELPASLRGGGLGLAAATAGVGPDAPGACGGLDWGTAGGFGAAILIGFGLSVAGLLASAFGLLATFGAIGFAGVGFGAALARLPCGATVLAVLRGFRAVSIEALFTGALVVALRGAALAAGRLGEAALGAGLATDRRRVAAGLPATVVGRLAIGLVLGFALGRAVAGRAAGTRLVAVACLAAAAVFLASGAGRRVGLLVAFPAEGRFPDPLAGVDAFMRAVSPSSTGHRERGTPSISLGPSPEKPERAMPWTTEPESALPSF